MDDAQDEKIVAFLLKPGSFITLSPEVVGSAERLNVWEAMTAICKLN